MSTLVTRMLTALSFIALLFVAVLVVRVSGWGSEVSLVSVTVPDSIYFPSHKNTEITSLDNVYAAVALPEFDMPTVVAKAAPARKQPRVRFMQVTKEVNILDEVFSPADMGDAQDVDGQWRQLQGAVTLPDTETVVLKPVEMQTIETTSLVALMDAVVLPSEEATMVAEVQPAAAAPVEEKVADAVSTKLAKSETVDADAEPVFFELPKKKEVEQKVAAEDKSEVAATTAVAEDEYSVPAGWDLPVGTQKSSASTLNASIKVDEDLITNGYVAPAGLPKSIQQSPVVAVNTQTALQAPDYSAPAQVAKSNKANVHTGSVTIHVSSIGLGKSLAPMGGVEIRAKDDDAQSWRTSKKKGEEGSVTIQEQVADGSYTRSLFINENEDEFVPTYTDVVMASEGQVDVPVFTQEKLAGFGEVASKVPTGSVLVQLDDTTEDVQLDGSVAKVLRLNENFVSTQGDEYNYLLFLGVEAGNRIMTVSQGNNRRTSRIIHVHAGAMTVDHNIYGGEQRLVVNLAEEDLMSRKKRPLVLSGEQVQTFFGGEKAQKLAPSKYAFRSGITMAGARQYLALTHHGEDVFVGMDGSKTAVVPSEAFMREVIRKFHINGNSSSCIVQVNLDKPAKRYQVISESYDEAHTSYGLVLDEDGQFYESMGEHSRRLFIMSESQTGRAESANARINIRLEYQDGSSRSFHSYCSPNSYLVEQL